MPEIRIVADENIPLVREFFGGEGDVTLIPGAAISQADLSTADALLVRSVTLVDGGILEKSRIQFVGSATIGTDHVDLDYLRRRGIRFAHAPGSNADSVVEYVIAALVALAARRSVRLRGKSIGIIGCGCIGGRLAVRADALGLNVLLNDPPLAEESERAGRPHSFLPLDEVLATADVTSLHVPLVPDGPHSTRHLLDRARLACLKKDAWLLNTARGSVVDNAALLSAIDRLGGVVLDVWENEPSPDPRLVERIDFATPHIAGYSVDGKVAGTRMLYDAFIGHFGRSGPSPGAEENDPFVPLAPPDPTLPETDWLHQAVRQMYPIAEDDWRMRSKGKRTWPDYFNALRREYPVRRTFSTYEIGATQTPPSFRPSAEHGLQIRLN